MTSSRKLRDLQVQPVVTNIFGYNPNSSWTTPPTKLVKSLISNLVGLREPDAFLTEDRRPKPKVCGILATQNRFPGLRPGLVA